MDIGPEVRCLIYRPLPCCGAPGGVGKLCVVKSVPRPWPLNHCCITCGRDQPSPCVYAEGDDEQGYIAITRLIPLPPDDKFNEDFENMPLSELSDLMRWAEKA